MSAAGWVAWYLSSGTIWWGAAMKPEDYLSAVERYQEKSRKTIRKRTKVAAFYLATVVVILTWPVFVALHIVSVLQGDR